MQRYVWQTTSIIGHSVIVLTHSLDHPCLAYSAAMKEYDDSLLPQPIYTVDDSDYTSDDSGQTYDYELVGTQINYLLIGH